MENLGPKRAGALGVAAPSVLEVHPDLLAVTSSGFGQTGPHAAYRAYAYNLQASGALGYLTRNLQGDSAEIDIAWADLISAYALATIVAAWAVGPSGNTGAGIDFSMTDLVVSHFNEYLAAASLGLGTDSADRANELAPFAPNGVYPTPDGWVAISVADDEQFERLADVLTCEPLRDPGYRRCAQRFERRAALDGLLAEATCGRSDAAGLAADLRTAGVIAEAVADASALVEDAQLDERGFFVPVDHPEWGRRRLVGVPWRVYGEQPLPLRPPPLLEAAS
jgi:crotonobetainyl-CoA:carnitine CoA-transferase CaiB-like acyl-CoA transferase